MKRAIKWAALMTAMVAFGVAFGVAFAMDSSQATPYIVGCNFVLTWSIGLYIYLHGNTPTPERRQAMNSPIPDTSDKILAELRAIRALLQAHAHVISSALGVKPNPFPWPDFSVLAGSDAPDRPACPAAEACSCAFSPTPQACSRVAASEVGK